MDIVTVYFFYGLSFFSMGLAVLLEAGRSSQLDFARTLRPLAGFGLVHGGHEWLEMFILIDPRIAASPAYDFIGHARVVLLAVSFLFLIAFGANLVAGPDRPALSMQMIGAIAAVWLAGLVWLLIREPPETEIIASDVYTRFVLAIPGAALAAWGLFLQRQKFILAGMRGFGRDMIAAALAFGLYGAVGQLFSAPSPVFPSTFLNSDTFLDWFGFPVQLFRGIMACIAAVAIISSLRAFEQETRRQIEGLQAARQQERRRTEELRAEMLRRTVRAQESERQRIARELHDELGQTLTALGMGLRGISGSAALNPERVEEQARQLQSVVDSGLGGLQNLITGLHPPQLDDFGLMAALRGYARQIQEQFDLSVSIESIGEEAGLSPEIRMILYRIVQESLTNVSRHARVRQASVLVVFGGQEVRIRIEDEGCGFDTSAALGQTGTPSWGLLGMIERAGLVGGECQIASAPGSGTLVEVSVPVKGLRDD